MDQHNKDIFLEFAQNIDKNFKEIDERLMWIAKDFTKCGIHLDELHKRIKQLENKITELENK